ncbi:MAG: KUP/HAK/KT family potassium transporter [Candidatus Eremiobacteraeota bacterium]|nr:KUP/HAK/KT family potassium transporter [Candidatus Eremiobacteraeota bacterium]
MPKRATTAPLALAALGVVFGDIATSPLYAFRQCFLGDNSPAAMVPNVLGVASLIFWTLVGVVCIKYATFVMKADHDGEGGTLALLGLIYPTNPLKLRTGALPVIALVILFGTAALYGDGVITPAISVLSAVEGLDMILPTSGHVAVPVTVLVLLGLFWLQPRGTQKIGILFGPVMLLWCIAIGIVGAVSIARTPSVLVALDPRYALGFVSHGGMTTVIVLGATVLCVSGAEALYADLGHFGIGPIRVAWYLAVFPALVLNYLGQGAQMLRVPDAQDVLVFYALVPGWGIVPMVVLATAATVIASQSLIAGAFSLTQQAVQLGYLPRVTVTHTSHETEGQIYIPIVNAVLAILCVLLVVTFKHSDALADAYGLAVTITMITTTVGYAALTRLQWHWPWWQTAAVTAFFLLFDGSFLIGNVPKIPTGGWIPLLIAIVVFTMFVTWYRGRQRQAKVLASMQMPLDEFLKEYDKHPVSESLGTAVFLTAHPHGVPYALSHQWLRTHLMFEAVVLLTIVLERRPYVRAEDRIVIEELRPHSFYRVTAHYGFMQVPNGHEILAQCRQKSPAYDFHDATYYLAESTVVRSGQPGALRPWEMLLFSWMLNNANPLPTALSLPTNQIIKVGVEVPV